MLFHIIVETGRGNATRGLGPRSGKVQVRDPRSNAPTGLRVFAIFIALPVLQPRALRHVSSSSLHPSCWRAWRRVKKPRFLKIQRFEWPVLCWVGRRMDLSKTVLGKERFCPKQQTLIALSHSLLACRWVERCCQRVQTTKMIHNHIASLFEGVFLLPVSAGGGVLSGHVSRSITGEKNIANTMHYFVHYLI